MSIRDEEAAIRERLRRLQELDLATYNRIVAENSRIYSKQMELYSVENELRQYGWPGAILFAYPGTYFMGRTGAEMRRRVSELLQRREYLINELRRERIQLQQLAEQRSIIAREIQELTARLTRIRQIITEQEARKAEMERRMREREQEIKWLLQELEEARRTGDLRRTEAVLRRLRELGFQI